MVELTANVNYIKTLITYKNYTEITHNNTELTVLCPFNLLTC